MRDMTALRDAIAKSIKERDFSDGWTPRDVQDACAEIVYELDAAAPAATQEPAGSVASEQRIQELAMVLAKRVLRVTRVDITSADSEEKARELLTLLVGPQSGSPRKVGEDGPDLIPRCMERHPEGGQCELRRGHARQHLAGMIMWASSSVPVGEQQKEKL